MEFQQVQRFDFLLRERIEVELFYWGIAPSSWQ